MAYISSNRTKMKSFLLSSQGLFSAKLQLLEFFCFTDLVNETFPCISILSLASQTSRGFSSQVKESCPLEGQFMEFQSKASSFF